MTCLQKNLFFPQSLHDLPGLRGIQAAIVKPLAGVYLGPASRQLIGHQQLLNCDDRPGGPWTMMGWQVKGWCKVGELLVNDW